MNTEHHKNEIAQIRKHVKMLNITGGIAIGALTIAGFLLVSDAFETTTDQDVASTEVRMDPIAENPETITGITDGVGKAELSATAASDKINTPVAEVAPAPAEHPDKLPSKKESISFEEELQSFEASCVDGSIAFHWITSGGSKYAYEIEKTYDQVNYEVFSRAPQPEKKDGKNIYSVEEATSSTEDAFYRLRKVVGKGKYEYSESVKVKCTEKEAFPTTVDVFPNGNGSFRIMINTANAGAYKVTLSDVNETELATEEFHANAGSNDFVLSSSSITKGNYVLRVSNDSMVKEKKVVLK